MRNEKDIKMRNDKLQMTNGEGEMGKEKDDKRRNEKGERRKTEGERQKEKEKTSRWNDQSGKSLSYCC